MSALYTYKLFCSFIDAYKRYEYHPYEKGEERLTINDFIILRKIYLNIFNGTPMKCI